MCNRKKAKSELNCALSDIIHAQQLLNEALKSAENKENKQIIQNTLSTLDNAVAATKVSAYGFQE